MAKQLTRTQWARRINETWLDAAKGMLTAIFKMGRDLIAAKEALKDEEGYGQFSAMVKNDLPFERAWAYRLMAIARDERLVYYSIQLPPDTNTLYKLTRLDDAMFKRLVKDGTINPTMGQNDASKILRIANVQADEERIENLGPIVGKFRTILLDPAWEYNWLSLAGRAKPGYAMQTLDQLYELDVRGWADDIVGCHLYCCTTNNFMYEACKLVDHWGFQHRTLLTWIKPPPFGLGSYFRNSTEHILFATLGDTTTKHAAASIPTHFEAPRGEHSEKPEKLYEIIRAASYAPYGEGNQRTKRKDFTNLFCPVTEKEEEAAE